MSSGHLVAVVFQRVDGSIRWDRWPVIASCDRRDVRQVTVLAASNACNCHTNLIHSERPLNTSFLL